MDCDEAGSARKLVVLALRELVDAIDRRVPHFERLGEDRIAGEAAALRHETVCRIQELTASPGDSDVRAAERSGAVMADDGGPLTYDEQTTARTARV